MRNRIGRHLARTALTITLILAVLVPSGVVAAQSESSTFADLDDYVEDQMDASRVPGVALSIVEGDEVVHARGFGHDSAGADVGPQTLFAIGSATKSITALAVMQLVEAGHIELDALVQQYIPWFRLSDPERSSDVTVRHLLTMTSGIPATAGGEAFRSTEAMTSEKAIRALRGADFAHDPGTSFEYVNANYVILGHIIESVSDLPYGDYVHQHIFKPLGMVNTYTHIAAAENAGFTPGHRYWFGRPVAFEMQQLPALVPAGYVISTSEDLSRYLTMFLNGGAYNGSTLLSEAGIELLLNGSVDAPLGPWADGTPAKYAMGWYVGGPWADGTVIFHPGSEPTFTSMILLDRANDRAVVTLMNASTEMPFPGAAGALREIPAGVMSILSGEQPADGAGLTRFYLVFNGVVLAIVLVQVLALVRLARRALAIRTHSPAERTRFFAGRTAIPLVWELGLGVGLLVAPALMAMSWRSLWLWSPDLGLVLIAISALWLVTAFLRIALIGSRYWRARPAANSRMSRRPRGGPAQVGQRAATK